MGLCLYFAAKHLAKNLFQSRAKLLAAHIKYEIGQNKLGPSPNAQQKVSAKQKRFFTFQDYN